MLFSFYSFLFFTSAVVLQQARVEASNAANEVAVASSNNTKDDIACLIHLYKYPGAKMHWTKYYGRIAQGD
jgi:hypothetical protein